MKLKMGFLIKFANLRFLLVGVMMPRFGVFWVGAIDTCRHTVQFRDLCPNPMFVSSSRGSVPDSDVTINLRGGFQHSSCEFFKDSNEVSSINGIHTAEQPWAFYGSNQCNHAVKLALDTGSSQSQGSEGYYYNRNSRDICKKDLGMKFHDEVYLWHNYSITAEEISFVDLITNYGHSPSDLECIPRPKFVLMLFLTFKYSKCSLIVQQYRLDDKSQGCDSLMSYPDPPSYKFCGAYPCTQEKSLLQELKLIGRRIPPPIGPNQGRQILVQAPSVSSEEVSAPDNHNHNNHNNQEQHHGHAFKPHSSNPYDPKNYPPPSPQAPTIFVSYPDGTSTEDPGPYAGRNEKPIDWNEWIVRMFFPAFGVAFIFLLLYILRERYAEEMCGRVNVNGHNPFQGSTISMDKEGLQI